MKYLLTLFLDETRGSDRTPEQMVAAMRAWDDYTRAVSEAGVHLGGEGLQPSSTATTVRIDERGDSLVSDGPFAETKEQLGGYYLLDCRRRARLGEEVPMPGGTVEVRLVMDYEAVGSGEHSNEARAEARP